MENQELEQIIGPASFGKRRARPRVCIADDKQHMRTFLGESLEELGFITCECAHVDEFDHVLARHAPNLVVIGLSPGGMNGADALRMLKAREFAGKILLLGSRNSPMVEAVRKLGEELCLDMLPLLATPFKDGHLRDSLASLLPIEEPPSPPVDVAEAVSAGWLELWYQPKIDTHMFKLAGGEGLIRMRHPTWGVVEPAYFIPADGDPHFCALSEFVVQQAIDDWCGFVGRQGPLEIAINLPLSVLQAADSIKTLSSKLPAHPAFRGLTVEINGTEIVRDLELVANIAKELRFHNIGISIDDLGAEWPCFMELDEFPFVEIKVDRKFVAGCADDRLKQTVCHRILEFAAANGVRTVAEGVETRTDFLCVREMGFDLAQGFLFGKAMPSEKFAKKFLDPSMAVAV
jgi:EAL domain-containing protein (putative c-di-GMP-specific phosphodiesterase class I)